MKNKFKGYFNLNVAKLFVVSLSILFTLTLFNCHSEKRGLINGLLKNTTIEEIKWGSLEFRDIKTIRSFFQVDYIDAIPYLGYSGVFITNKYSRKRFKELDTYYQNKSIFKCELNRYCHCKNNDVSMFSKDSLNIILIPDMFFDKKRFFLSEHEISEESTAYILSFKKGEFLQKEKRFEIKDTYYKTRNKEYNEYGYSVGVFLDEENLKITNWIILW